MPGPQYFIQNIAQDLREGKNVVICLPRYSPDKLAVRIREAINEGNRWEYLTNNNYYESSPIDFLYQYFLAGCDAKEVRTIPNFLNHFETMGKIIWIDGISELSWPYWKEFIIKYEPVCRGKSLLERTVFCILLKGELAIHPPREDVCLSVRIYSGISDSLDMLIYASHMASGSVVFSSGIIGKLMPVIISKIALWDPYVAEVLLRQPMEILLSPSKILKDIAIEREWMDNKSNIRKPLWELGMKNVFEEEECFHSCILGKLELERRLWSAQLGVIYPYIEEQRQIILKHIKKFISVPYTTRFGDEISDINDLEIGHIEAILSNNSSFSDRRMLKRISDLRKARNDLAHLTPLEKTFFLSEAIRNPLKYKI